jgi:hypothetical protein
VYFIRCNEFVKIGITLDVKKRLASLQSSCPYPLELLAAAKGGSLEEYAMHARFRAELVRGEWFNLTVRLQDYIQGVKDGSSLPLPTATLCAPTRYFVSKREYLVSSQCEVGCRNMRRNETDMSQHENGLR